VVLSDGQDTSSLITFDELLDFVKRSHVVIYPIRLGSTTPRPIQVRDDSEFELRRLAQETGGRLLAAKDAAGLSNVYNQIADELSSQYVLGYLSNSAERGQGWRSISVRVARPNLQVRTRTGYHFTAQGRLWP
jgi:VWFA-related protein